MKFARVVFAIAAAYGLLIIPPMLFLEARIGREYPPEITHPVFFYGFVGAVGLWQVLYAMIAYDPLRYRPLMLLGAAAKGAFVITVAILVSLGREPLEPQLPAVADMILAPLFVAAFWATRPASKI